MVRKGSVVDYWDGPPEPKLRRSKVDMFMPLGSFPEPRGAEPLPEVAGRAGHEGAGNLLPGGCMLYTLADARRRLVSESA